MNELSNAFLVAWEHITKNASAEALAVYLMLAEKGPASPASLAKWLALPQARILRALAELATSGSALVSTNEAKGGAGRRMVTLTAAGSQLQILLMIPETRNNP